MAVFPEDCITVIQPFFRTPADFGGIPLRAVQLEVGLAMQTDQDLIARLRESDPSPALSELFRRHGRMVERTVRRMVRDEHLAQDVCQASPTSNCTARRGIPPKSAQVRKKDGGGGE